MNSAPEPGPLAALAGRTVVIDLDGPWLAFGRLESCTPPWLVLADADLHDLGEGTSTRDVYALETRKLGVRVNRRSLLVPMPRVVAVSALDDVTA